MNNALAFYNYNAGVVVVCKFKIRRIGSWKAVSDERKLNFSRRIQILLILRFETA
jgi:hypothetical protein